MRRRGARWAGCLGAVVLLAGLAACSDDDAPAAASCRAASLPTLTKGRIVLGAPTELVAPWYEDSPDSGKGYESEVGYAVARALGFRPDQVRWVQLDRAEITAAGAHRFDVALAEVDRRGETQRRVDLSRSYLRMGAAVVAAEGTPAASLSGSADLATMRLGLLGTAFEPESAAAALGVADEPMVLDDVTTALARLGDGTVDALVMDVPSALAAARQAPRTRVVGQLDGLRWELGAVLERGSRLTRCVDRAVQQLQVDGSLTRLQQAYLGDELAVPVVPAG